MLIVYKHMKSIVSSKLHGKYLLVEFFIVYLSRWTLTESLTLVLNPSKMGTRTIRKTSEVLGSS